MVQTDADLMTQSSVEGTEENGRNADTSFAGLLSEYDYQKPQRGQLLQGEVLTVNDDAVLVDLGLKRDGMVPRKDLDRLDDATLQRLEPGAEVMVYVLRAHGIQGDLIVSINKALEYEDWIRADDLMGNGEVVEAEVVGTNRGGVLVQFGRIRAFVPQSHLTSLPRGHGGSEDERRGAMERLIGQTLVLKVIDMERRRDRLVLSERAARAEARMARIAAFEVGQVLTGHVVSLQNYGAFVDVGGVDGLIHVSELDWQRVNLPGDVLSVGDEVEVLVKNVDVERERISLSRKALLPSPWDTAEENYHVDDLVTGTVANVVDFGAFLALPSGLEGLVHVSQMSTFGASQPGDMLRRGDEVLVRIKDIDADRKRMALSLDAVTSSEHLQWMEARAEADTDESMPPEAPNGNEALNQSVPDAQSGGEPAPGEDNDVEGG